MLRQGIHKYSLLSILGGEGLDQLGIRGASPLVQQVRCLLRLIQKQQVINPFLLWVQDLGSHGAASISHNRIGNLPRT